MTLNALLSSGQSQHHEISAKIPFPCPLGPILHQALATLQYFLLEAIGLVVMQQLTVVS